MRMIRFLQFFCIFTLIKYLHKSHLDHRLTVYVENIKNTIVILYNILFLQYQTCYTNMFFMAEPASQRCKKSGNRMFYTKTIDYVTIFFFHSFHVTKSKLNSTHEHGHMLCLLRSCVEVDCSVVYVAFLRIYSYNTNERCYFFHLDLEQFKFHLGGSRLSILTLGKY